MVKDILTLAKEDMKDYGDEVLTERAIPDYRDGLKPVHRRILWAMYEMGLKHTGGTKKCARIVGDVIGKYHPHGDAATYQALVGMTKTGSPCPTVYGQGNFGDIEDPPAAFRYTEAKLTAFADKYLLDPDYLAVTPMVPNYDQTEMEPLFLPSKLPGPFLFGTEGIAIGCSNLMPAFTKESVIELVKKAITTGEASPSMLAETLKFKFTYGGVCKASKKELREYFHTGFSRVNFRCKISEGKADRTYTIDTMAPRIKPTKVEMALAKMKEIQSVDMVRSRQNPRFFEFKVKKSADEEEVVKKVRSLLTSSLNLQTYITVRKKNDVIFRRTTPVILLLDWIKWRLLFEKKVIQRLMGLEQVQVQKFEWLIWACNHLDLIKKSLESKNPDKYLMKHGNLPAEAADWILSQQVRRLAKLEIEGLKAKKAEREKRYASLDKDLNSGKRLVKRVVASLD